MKDLEGTLALVLVAMVAKFERKNDMVRKAAFRPGWLCECDIATKYLYPLPPPRIALVVVQSR